MRPDIPTSSIDDADPPTALSQTTPPVALFGAIGGGALLATSAMLALIWVVSPARAQAEFNSLANTLVGGGVWKPWWYFATLVGLLALEGLVLGWSRSSLYLLFRGSRSARADFVVAACHWTGWSSVLTTIFSGGALWLVSDLVAPFQSFQLVSHVSPKWFQALIVFVTMDFLLYWYHRISHEVAFLWEAHKYHHSATEFTILTGNRIHALEEVFQQLFVLIPLAILGTSGGLYIAVRLVILCFDMLQHSMLPWTYGWFGQWVIYSPVAHRVHHSAEREHWDKNYGDILVIWDRIFGTWYAGTRVNTRVDVSENPYNRQSIIAEYMLCAVFYFRAFAHSARTGHWRTEHQRQMRKEQ